MWLTASILAWTRGGSPSKIAPSHWEGVWGFGKDAEIERPKALQDAKPSGVLIGIENLLHFYKNGLFLQAESRRADSTAALVIKHHRLLNDILVKLSHKLIAIIAVNTKLEGL